MHIFGWYQSQVTLYDPEQILCSHYMYFWCPPCKFEWRQIYTNCGKNV